MSGTASQPLDYQAVVGMDVGDRKTHYCVLDLKGELVLEGAVATRETSLGMQFGGKARMRIALEAGALAVDEPATNGVGPRSHCGESPEAPHDFGE